MTPEKKKIIVLIILVFTIATTTSFNITYNSIEYRDNSEPKPADIMHTFWLLSPEEGVSYLWPDNGYYPAPYGFENDDEGIEPSGWTIDAETTLGGTAKVLGNLDGHNNIVELNDTIAGIGRNVRATRIFDDMQNHGDIELWVRTTDVLKDTVIEISNNSGVTVFSLSIHQDNWTDGTLTTLQKVSGGSMDAPTNNKWHHVRITFESRPSPLSGYEELDQYQWKIWVDGQESIPQNFVNNSGNIDRLTIKTTGNHTDYSTYFDSVGYSWAPGYNTGDNLNEGLLISFDDTGIPFPPFEPCEWYGYSFDDDFELIPVLGDFCIPMPEYGPHSIQIYGTHSSYPSNLFTSQRVSFYSHVWQNTPGWDRSIYRIKENMFYDVFIGDANNDGYNDVITANIDNDSISIFPWMHQFNNWSDPIKKICGNGPMNVFIEDANNDGYNDIIVANAYGDTVSIFLWDAASSNWEDQITKSVGDMPESLFVGDANNDGYKDIVTANRNHDNISIVLWNENSSMWDDQITKNVGDIPEGIFIGDVNNDGFNDIVTANRGDDNISIILWNSTSMTWNDQITKPVGQAPSMIFVEDINNDGYNDIITGEEADWTLSIYLWNSTISDWGDKIVKLVEYRFTPAVPSDIFVDDVNSDGYNDLIVLCNDIDKIAIFHWDNSLKDWNEPIFLDGEGGEGFFIGDADNDGYNDIAISAGIPFLQIYLWNIIPPITINNPNDFDIFGENTPHFNLSITDIHADRIWYSLDGGITRIFCSKNGTINQGLWDDVEDGPITITFFASDTSSKVGFAKVTIMKNPLLFIQVVDQIFSTDEFNITILVSAEGGTNVDFATIQMWWNGSDVSSDVENLGLGLYRVQLTSITVSPREDPILLNMTISIFGYNENYFEIFIAVDPDSLIKDEEIPTGGFPLETIIITIVSIMGGVGAAGVTIFLLRRRKRFS